MASAESKRPQRPRMKSRRAREADGDYSTKDEMEVSAKAWVEEQKQGDEELESDTGGVVIEEEENLPGSAAIFKKIADEGKKRSTRIESSSTEEGETSSSEEEENNAVVIDAIAKEVKTCFHENKNFVGSEIALVKDQLGMINQKLDLVLTTLTQLSKVPQKLNETEVPVVSPQVEKPVKRTSLAEVEDTLTVNDCLTSQERIDSYSDSAKAAKAGEPHKLAMAMIDKLYTPSERVSGKCLPHTKNTTRVELSPKRVNFIIDAVKDKFGAAKWAKNKNKVLSKMNNKFYDTKFKSAKVENKPARGRKRKAEEASEGLGLD